MLARLVVDSLDGKAIGKLVGTGPPNERSISTLERFLDEESFEGAGLAISALRDLQDLRSKVAAHKNSSTVATVIESTLGTTDTVAGIMSILIRLCEAMRTLEEQC